MAISPSGPVPARVMIVGEAPGKDEDMLGVPFVGSSGQELRRMLKQAEIDPAACFMTNVFMDRPQDNDITKFCGNRASVGKDYPWPALSSGNYPEPTRAARELDRLSREIAEVRPDLILAVGNTPCWALIQRVGISKLRGSLFPCGLAGHESIPVLPTYHPAAILRDWSLRVIAVADLVKGKRFLNGEIRPRRRELWLEPTLEEVKSFFDQWVYGVRPKLLSFDIETARESITCIGFAPDTDRAITVPFFDPRKRDGNYWSTHADELAAWRMCVEVLQSDIPKLGQNGLYDIQYCHRFGIRVNAYAHDTMIRHHALQPEMEKGLGFMASIYTDEAPWKVLRDRNRDNLKIDDE